jgi:isopentenyldiphosphate isomerase
MANGEELVDIVDNLDTTQYQIAKADAHDQGLLHRCVIGEVRTSDGKYMLIKQAADRQDAGLFTSPVGGHVAAGEEVKAAFQREVGEELGLYNVEFRFIGNLIFNRFVKNRQENHLFEVFEMVTDLKPTISSEITEYRYFTEVELKNLLKTNPKLFGEAYLFVVKTFYPQLLT